MLMVLWLSVEKINIHSSQVSILALRVRPLGLLFPVSKKVFQTTENIRENRLEKVQGNS